MLSEFWQTWGNTCREFSCKKCRTDAAGAVAHKFGWNISFTAILFSNLSSNYISILPSLYLVQAIGKISMFTAKNVTFWPNVTNLTKDEISDGELGNLSRRAQLTAILSDLYPPSDIEFFYLIFLPETSTVVNLINCCFPKHNILCSSSGERREQRWSSS